MNGHGRMSIRVAHDLRAGDRQSAEAWRRDRRAELAADRLAGTRAKARPANPFRAWVAVICRRLSNAI